MSSWRLPTRLEVGGKAYPIHSDYRDILDILHRLNDASEPEFIRWRVALALFYEGDLPRSDYPEAMQKLADFLNCGQTLPRSPAPPLLDWEQDAPLIAADINKAAGCEVRALPYLHWWTFMAWFNSIGDGQLATLLGVDPAATGLQQVNDFQLDLKQLKTVQPANAKEGYLYLQLPNLAAGEDAPQLILGIEKQGLLKTLSPKVHILLDVPAHHIHAELSGTVTAAQTVVTVPTSRMQDSDVESLVQLRKTIESIVQFVQTAAQSDDAAAPAA